MPSSKPVAQSHTRAVNLRIREETRALIDRAARAQGRSRSDFMIEASRRAAEEAILDQTVIQLDPDSYQAFLRMLENPGLPNEKLRGIMRTSAPWEG